MITLATGSPFRWRTILPSCLPSARYPHPMDELRRLNSVHDSMDEPLGMPSAPSARSRGQRATTRTRSSTTGAFDLWAAGILTFAQLIFSGAVTFGALLNAFAFDGCGSPNPECNYTLGTLAFYLVPAACAIILVLTVVTIVVRYRRVQPTWWIPVAGAGAALVFLVVSIVLTSLATGRPPW